jgi:hypothetical protein
MGMIEGLSDNYLPVLFPFPREIRNEIISVQIDNVEVKEVQGTRLTVHGTPDLGYPSS